MKAPFYVETIARNGEVLHRHVVPSLPIRIGRGYDNDYIIDDDYVAANHAVVDLAEDGQQLVLRDLGSRNGIVHRGKRQQQVVVNGDTVVRMGHTMLRVRPSDFKVAPEMVDRTRHGWEGAAPGFIGMGLILAFALFALWINDTLAFQPIRYLQAAAFGIGAGLAWAGIWAVVNRLFGRHARLGRHLFILGSALAVLTLFQLGSSIVAYAFSLDALTRYSSHVAIAIACVMLFYHLATVKPQLVRRFAIGCTALFVLVSGLTLLSNVQRTGRLADDLYMSLVLPPSVRVSPDHSVDEFMGQVQQLKPRLDQDRTKKVRGSDEDEED